MVHQCCWTTEDMYLVSLSRAPIFLYGKKLPLESKTTSINTSIPTTFFSKIEKIAERTMQSPKTIVMKEIGTLTKVGPER